MAINSNVRNNQNILEYGKFVELINDSNFPPLTTTRTGIRDDGSSYSSTQIYPKYAVLSHLTNPEDIKVSLSAEQINVNVADIETLLASTNSVLSSISSINFSLNTKLPALSTASNRLMVDNSTTTQTVSGTVTVVQPTAANLKTQAECFQNSSAVGPSNPLQVSLANTGSNTNVINVSGSGIFRVTSSGSQGESIVTSFSGTSSGILENTNLNRKLVTIYNEGTGALFVLLGSGTASTTNYSFKLNAGDYFETDKYTGEINGIFSTSGIARITEIT